MQRSFALVVLMCLAAVPALAQTQMPESVLAAGGADMLGSHELRGTVAQSGVGFVVGVSYRLEIGFWHGFRELVSSTPGVVDYIWDLKAAYPNPFNPRTTIGYSMPEASHVTLRIYDLRGSLVSTLVNGPVEAGDHAVAWNGRDDRGSGVASGVYFARIDSKHGVLTRKMVLAR